MSVSARGDGPAGGAEAALAAGLLPDERVLWTGRPDPARLVAVERKWWPGGIAVLAIAAWMIWRTDAVMLAAVVAAFGLNALTLPFRAARAGPGILYAVTDKRVRIVDPARLQPMQEYPFTALQLQLHRPPGASEGDLILRRRDFFPAAVEGVARQRRPVLFGIEAPEEVARLIREQAVRYAHNA
ncbi:hypothetical protein [Geminicoccus roseus]|uniref:hypothetical protein n=1 Tax=Geminicoccus roseus TaxID=404900 RepID=UPI00042942B6|nr:hypothetical protein [Geminicoccus roseus]